MSKTPKTTLNRIVSVRDAWQRLRPDKTFAGLTLEQYKAAIQPSLEPREEIAQHEGAIRAAITRRDAADPASLEVALRIVDAVKSDHEEGRDGELYDAMGYVRKSVRSTGLTRRRSNGGMKDDKEPGPSSTPPS